MAASGRLGARDRRPTIIPFGWLIDAFWELSTARAIGFGGVGPIPITAIWAFADRHDCPPWFAEVIQAADLDYLAAQRHAGASDG